MATFVGGLYGISYEKSKDIIFINSDNEVISVHEGKPNDKTPITEKNVKYVIEVNANSEITEGDDLEFEDDSDKMLVLDQDGNV